ncbi:hypothetical protein JCM11641_000147 [Rhodosporidiobolus odoratus]
MTLSLHATPIPERPPPSYHDRVRSLTFNIIFGAGIVLTFLFQLIVLPFALLPQASAQKLFRGAISYSKDVFASLLILIVHVFGPTTLVLTADDSVNLEELVRRDAKGDVTGFNLAKQALWISNHQQYADWIYPWILMSFGSVASGLVIVLKASLEWAPIVGPAMQLFHFCFIDKKKTLGRSNLYRTAAAAVKRDEPYQALLFPEGTLYSVLTRPKSAKYAESLGIPNATNVLLPRSAGLFFSLRCLLALIPASSLTFYDLTVGYTGVPAQGFAQSYYTLQSAFGRGIAPPTVHMHFRQHRVEDVPLGKYSATAPPRQIEASLTSEDKQVFDTWLREKWQEKDLLMGGFGEKGEFPTGPQGKVEFRIRMRTADWVMLGSVPVVLWIAYRGVRVAWAVLSFVI